MTSTSRLKETTFSEDAESITAAALLNIRSRTASKPSSDDGSSPPLSLTGQSYPALMSTVAAISKPASVGLSLLQNSSMGGLTESDPSLLRQLLLLNSKAQQQQTNASLDCLKKIATLQAAAVVVPGASFPHLSGAVSSQDVAMNALLTLKLYQQGLFTTSYPLSLASFPSSSHSSVLLPSQQAVRANATKSTDARWQLKEDKRSELVNVSVAEAITKGPSLSHEALISKEQVEAALRSKPQRGRKRENLSDMERLELTKIRNREHAKSTRMRKKMRYEELLQGEKKLLKYEVKKSIEDKRRNCVVRFLSIRKSMLLSAMTESTDPSTPNASDQAEKKSDRFSQELGAVIHNADKFILINNTDTSKGSHAVVALMEFDEALIRRVENRFGRSALSCVAYKLQGSTDNIALDSEGSGFAEVDLVLSSQAPIRLISYLLRFEFKPRSERLSSVKLLTLSDALGDTSQQGLNLQMTFPSAALPKHATAVDNRNASFGEKKGQARE